MFPFSMFRRLGVRGGSGSVRDMDGERMNLSLKIPNLLRVHMGCAFGAVDVVGTGDDKGAGWAEGGDGLG